MFNRHLMSTLVLVSGTLSVWAWPHTPPDEARVAAIAAALPETPGGATRFDDPPASAQKGAERLLDEAVPETPDALYLEFTQNGNRTHYQDKRGRRFSFLSRLALAEAKEKKGRFIPKICETLEAIATQRSWVLPAHDLKLENFNNGRLTIDLVSSDTAYVLADVLVAFRGRLPEATVKHVTDEVYRRVFNLYLADIRAPKRPRNGWWYSRANWNPVCHAGTVMAALRLVPDRTERARFVEAALRAQAAFMDGFTPDGYCSEGMGYWEYGFGHFLDLGLDVRAATGGKFDLFKDCGERAHAAASYPFRYQLQTGIAPHFADGGGNPSERRRRQCLAIWPDLVEFKGPLPERSTFPDAQVFISRAGGDCPFAVAVKGGNNHEFHNHNDVGTWTLMLAGEELAGDPGGEVYTARTFSKDRYVSKVLNSFGHPVPRVAGTLQPKGGDFRAKVLRTDFSEAQDVVVMDLAGAYEAKGLKKLVRTTIFDRARRAFTVKDEVAFETPAAFDVPLVTFCAVAKGAEKTALALTTAKGRKAAVTIAAKGGDWELQEEEIINPGRSTPRRLAVTFVQPVAEAEVSYTLKEEK